MGIVQQTVGFGTATFAVPTTPGNAVIVGLSYNSPPPPTSVTDDAAQVYTQIETRNDGVGGYNVEIFAFLSSVAVQNITSTPNGWTWAYEVSGLTGALLDSHNAAGNSANPTPGALVGAGGFYLALASTDFPEADFTSINSPWILDPAEFGGQVEPAHIDNGTGTQSPVFVSSGSGHWAAVDALWAASALINSATALTSSEAPSFFEDEVTLSVAVTGGGPTPTGTVTLTDDADPAGGFGGPYILTLDGSGNASFITNSLAVGIHNITAEYSGDGTYNPSSHTLEQQVVAVNEPSGFLPGFALNASFNPQGDDALTPTAELFAVPSSGPAHTSITLLWAVLNVPKIRITGSGFDTGYLSTTGSGAYVVGNGFTATIVLTLACYDVDLNPILVNLVPLTATTTVTVT